MAEMSDTQRKALMEKLEKMSPEELREFQKKQCIFCQIASAKVKSRKVYEDEKTIAVLDINPANKGHVLVMPKEHYAILPQIPEEEISHLGIVAKRLSHAILKGLKVQGTSIFIANGTAAGQRAQHFMLHIIPRDKKDSVGLVIPQKQVEESEISKVRERIQNKLNENLGIKKEIVTEKKDVKQEHHSTHSEEEPEEETKSSPESHKETRKPTKSKSKSQDKSEHKSRQDKPHRESHKADKKSDVSLDDIANLFR